MLPQEMLRVCPGDEPRDDTCEQGKSESPTRRISRCPGPLEVEAAEVAGDVYSFADEVEAGGVSGFH